jgi:hypothetical protein
MSACRHGNDLAVRPAGSQSGSERRPGAQHHRLHRELAQRFPQAGEGRRTRRHRDDRNCGQTRLDGLGSRRGGYKVIG